jgi:hypothetical protein
MLQGKEIVIHGVEDELELRLILIVARKEI